MAAGAVARKVIEHVTGKPAEIRGALIQIGSAGDRARPLGLGGGRPQSLLLARRRDGRALEQSCSTGCARPGPRPAPSSRSLPAACRRGWAHPIYGKLDADLAAAMMSINAVKGVEIGAGFAAAALTGEANADEMRMGNGRVDLRLQQCRRHPGRHLHRPGHRRSLRGQADQLDPDAAPHGRHSTGEDAEIATKGRHDPCVGIRAVPVGEAMMAIVLADHLLRHRAQVGRSTDPSTAKHAHQLQMRRPGKLVDGQETLQAEAAIDQEPRIAGEAARVAGDIDREIETRGRDRGRLRPGAGPRRIEQHGVEAIELRRRQRAPPPDRGARVTTRPPSPRAAAASAVMGGRIAFDRMKLRRPAASAKVKVPQPA